MDENKDRITELLDKIADPATPLHEVRELEERVRVLQELQQ